MQSMAKANAGDAARPAKPTIANTLAYIYRENGIKGLYRGVTPRIGLGIWQTVRCRTIYLIPGSTRADLVALLFSCNRSVWSPSPMS